MAIFGRRRGFGTYSPDKQRGANALTASGFRVKQRDGDVMRRLIQPWQARAFAYYDLVPEIKYASQFYSRALSVLRLYPAIRNDRGDLEETEDPDAVEQLQRIQDPGGGTSGLLTSYGRLMFLVGECYLFVSENHETGSEQWEMLSTDELRVTGANYVRYKAPSMQAENYEEPSDEDWADPLTGEPNPDATLQTYETGLAVAYRIWRRHPRYCADDKTEILTEDGWKPHSSLRPGERVLTLNHETGESEWQPVSAVNRFQVEDEEMVSVEGAAHSSLTTLEHRWPTLHKGQSRLDRWWTDSEHLNSSDRLITAAACKDVPTVETFSDAFVEAVAWFWTEGNIACRYRSAQVSICQSESANPANVASIRESLTTLYGEAATTRMSTGSGPLAAPKWREYREPNRDTVYFWLNTAASAELLQVAPDKVVSLDFVRALTRDQLQLFVDVSAAADGNVGPNGTRVLAQKDPRRLAAYEFACILLGTAPHTYVNSHVFTSKAGEFTMTVTSVGTKKGWHIQPKSRRVGPRGINSVPTRQRYTGTVWCPTTRNGTWLARRNGCVYYTGNSFLADATMQGVLDVAEEIVLLTQVIRSRARSRMAGAGILLVNGNVSPVPAEAVPDEDPDEDPFVRELTLSMTQPIVDEGTASAVVPIVVRVDVDKDSGGIDNVMKHIQLVDPVQIYPETGLRFELIKRLAIGLDMPPEVLLGLEDTNHWSAWAVDEQTWKSHLQPVAQQLVDDLTSAFYQPTMRDLGKENWQDYFIAYDATAVINHPDRSKDANELYDRRAIGKQALRDAKGFDDEDAPTVEELNEQIGVALRDGSYAKYGVPTVRGTGGIEPEAGEILTKTVAGGLEDVPVGQQGPQGPPDGSSDPALPEEVLGAANGHATEAFVARVLGAADLALYRARELAGNRLRNLAKRDPEATKLLDGVRARDVAHTLGRERAAQLGAPPARELVAGARDFIMDAMRVWGLDDAILAPVGDRIEQHAAKTLYDERQAALPASFSNYVAGLKAAA